MVVPSVSIFLQELVSHESCGTYFFKRPFYPTSVESNVVTDKRPGILVGWAEQAALSSSLRCHPSPPADDPISVDPSPQFNILITAYTDNVVFSLASSMNCLSGELLQVRLTAFRAAGRRATWSAQCCSGWWPNFIQWPRQWAMCIWSH